MTTPSYIQVYRDLEQGSEEWLQARCGLLTASEMKLILAVEGGGTCVKYRATGATPAKLTPKRQQALEQIGSREGSMRDLSFVAEVSDGVLRDLLRDGALEAVQSTVPRTFRAPNDDKERSHLYELAAQRISGYVEPTYIGDAMLRGQAEEIEARRYYEHNFAPVEEVGFIVNRQWGFAIGYSPDGLVGDEGLIEVKSRKQSLQVQTILEHVHDRKSETIPVEFMLQCQTGLLVSERAWLDFISFSGGLPMAVIRVWPDPDLQGAIVEAAEAFEGRIAKRIADYRAAQTFDGARLVPTERILFTDILA